VIAGIKQAVGALNRRPRLRVALQALVSVAILGVLVEAAQSGAVGESLHLLRPTTLVVAVSLQIAAFAINSRRWQLLLRHVGIRESLRGLTSLYFIGSFVSLFLPSSAGGDAVRVYEVARRSGRAAETIVATLQERLLGLGASLFLGLVATLYYLPILPPEMLAGVLLLEIVGTLGALALLYPAPLLALGRRLWRNGGKLGMLGRWRQHPLTLRVIERLQPLVELPTMRPVQLLLLCGLALVGVLLGIGMCHVLALGLDIRVGFIALCLTVPLVWIVKMLPVSLNGIGVGEGAFVFLLGLFAVPKGQALALALVILGLQSTVALIGGLVLVVRMLRGSRPATGPAVPARPAVLDIAEVAVVLLAGGLATRLRPITAKVPKALVEVAGRPFIDHQLALLKRNGIRRVVLCLGYLGEQVEAYLGDGAAFGMELRYSYDGDRLLGTGGALRRALPLLGEAFWVMYGDSYMDIDYRRVLKDFGRRDVLGLMTVLRNNNSWDTSNVVFQNGRLLRYDKRVRLPEMTHIDYGVALLRRAALERIPAEERYDLAELYSALVAEGRMAGHEVTRRFYEIGSPRGLAETQAYLSRRAA
jgi:uncharacterized protein (TIRG00374 family)